MFIPGRTPWTPLFGAEIGGVRGGAPKKILSVSYCFERSRSSSRISWALTSTRFLLERFLTTPASRSTRKPAPPALALQRPRTKTSGSSSPTGMHCCTLHERVCFGVWVYVVTGPVRYGQIDVRVRARSARGVRDLDIIWTPFGGVDTSVYQGGQYTGNLPPPLFGVDGHKNY